MLLNFLVSALVTLVVVVDPVGLAPTFLAVTSGLPNEVHRQTLRKPADSFSSPSAPSFLPTGEQAAQQLAWGRGEPI
jgi:small neutral amino acid transporter SnatA (MarC family)